MVRLSCPSRFLGFESEFRRQQSMSKMDLLYEGRLSKPQLSYPIVVQLDTLWCHITGHVARHVIFKTGMDTIELSDPH